MKPPGENGGRSDSTPQEILFEVTTPLGFVVRCTKRWWDIIVTQKHPALAGKADEVRGALEDPDEVRRSRNDAEVLLFYRGSKPRWICAVVKREDGTGFLITAYPADVLKSGEVIWTRSK